MTAGRGFLALAAVVFGQWRPYGVLFACLVFGFTDALQLRLQSIGAVPVGVWICVSLLGLAVATYAWWKHRSLSRRWVFLTAAALLVGGLVGVVLAPQWQLPSQFWLSLPYVLSLVALAVSSRNVRAPAMIGRPLESSAQR